MPNVEQNVTCSIDNISLTGHDSGRFESVINDPSFSFIEYSSMARQPYKRKWHCTDGSLIQWTDQETVSIPLPGGERKDVELNPMRYEFNPNRANSKEHREAVARVLETFKYPKLTRFDIAFDFKGYDLTNYQIKSLAAVKTNHWLDSYGRLETLYIGAPGADLRIRIYDKAKEQKLKDEKWWRIEAQYRGPFALTAQGVRSGFPGLPASILNPFEHLKIYKPNWQNAETFQEKAYLKMLLENPGMISELSKNARTKYKKLLADLPSDKEINMSSLFKQNHDDLLRQIKDWLYHASKNNPSVQERKYADRTPEELELSLENYIEYSSRKENEKIDSFTHESIKAHLTYNTILS